MCPCTPLVQMILWIRIFHRGRALFDPVRLALADQPRGDDVLAPATPIVGAIAGRAGGTGFIKRDPHAVSSN